MIVSISWQGRGPPTQERSDIANNLKWFGGGWGGTVEVIQIKKIKFWKNTGQRGG